MTAALVALCTLVLLLGCFEASTTSEATSFVWDWLGYLVAHDAGEAIFAPWGYRSADPEVYGREYPAVDAALEIRDVVEMTERAGEYAWQAEVAVDGGDIPLAVEQINDALELRPGDWRYRYRAGAYALAESDVDVWKTQDDAATQQTIDSHVSDEKSYSEAIEAYESVFDYTQANASREARVHITNELYESYYFRAEARAREGRAAEANADYARAKEYKDLIDEL